MLRRLTAILLFAAWVHAQTAAPPAITVHDPKNPASGEDLFPTHKVTGTVSLVRGVLKQIDPIHDHLVVQTFGGGDVRIAFDGQTKLISESTGAHVTSIQPGSVVSVDTGLQDGKLFARSVRVGTSSAAELNGQIVEFDRARSRLTLREPISPENIFVQVRQNTVILQHAQSATQQALLPGSLAKVSFSPVDKAANRIEILAERGESFTFQGRIVAVDLRSRTVSLSTPADQSVRDLTFGALDRQSTSRLREGESVTIQAEFDGDHYNIRSVSPVAPHNP
jgi:hypothetical protein